MATNISYNMPSTCLPMPLTSTLNVLITGHWKSGKSMLIKSLLHNAKNVKCLSLLNQAVVNTFDIIDESLDHQSLTFSLIECPVRDASGQNLCVNYINLQMNRALQHEFLHLYSFERPTDLVDPCVHVCLYLMKFENEEGATENDIKFFTELGETKVPIVPLIACSDLYSEEKLSAIRKKLNEDFDGIIYDFPYKKDRTNLPLALSLVNHRIVVEDHYYSPDNKNRWKAIVYGLLCNHVDHLHSIFRKDVFQLYRSSASRVLAKRFEDALKKKMKEKIEQIFSNTFIISQAAQEFSHMSSRLRQLDTSISEIKKEKKINKTRKTSEEDPANLGFRSFAKFKTRGELSSDSSGRRTATDTELTKQLLKAKYRTLQIKKSKRRPNLEF
ncbi:uncharacterized protein LOC135145998 [Zophobas morio]|uniref:uncharacterized protein LOC135145998 n=1 Tax=Zophobas morio TaxID=2755281 RepID=UPI0030828939